MSRRSRQNDATVTLFPFLAVLICTMGSLIVLLVIVVQQAGTSPPSPDEIQNADVQSVADSKAHEPPEVDPDIVRQKELEQEKEDLSWRAEMLASSREETRRQLMAEQVELSRAEDQIRKINDELDRLYAMSERLKSAGQEHNGTDAELAQQLAQKKEQIQAEREALAKATELVKKAANAFALVAYDGPNGTYRRPIYIECFSDRVVLQPEGAVLTSADFRIPQRPGNVLASAIRAIREYYLNQGIVNSSAEPYPLLVVRPGAAEAYGLCLCALEHWDGDYGYELVAEDVELAYPNPDPALQRLIQQALQEARWRLEQSLSSQPRAVLLSVSPTTGGFVREGDGGGSISGAGPASVGRDQLGTSGGGLYGDGGPYGHSTTGHGAAAFAAGEAVAGHGPGASGPYGASPNGSGPLGAGRSGPYPVGNMPSGNDLHGGRTSQRIPSGSEGGGPGDGGPGDAHARNGNARNGNARNGGPESGGPWTAGNSGHNGDPQGSNHAPINGRGGAFAGGPSGGGVSTGVSNAGSGSTRQTHAGGSATAGSSAAGASAAGSSAGGGAAGGGAASSDAAQIASAAATMSIARRQGANWALPGAAMGAIPIQRPVHVECLVEGLRLRAEQGVAGSSVTVPWSGASEGATRKLVKAIWDRIDAWGIAGAGAYWKPVVELDVQPGAERRYYELGGLLQDSGIEVNRR